MYPKVDNVLLGKLYDRFKDDVVNEVMRVVDHFSQLSMNDKFMTRYRVQRITDVFLGGMTWSERDYMIALYGTVAPSAAVEDFCSYLLNAVPIIHNYFQANHGLNDFVGKWVVTKHTHSAYNTIPKGTVVKIIDMSTRGFDISTENGIRVCEVGFSV